MNDIYLDILAEITPDCPLRAALESVGPQSLRIFATTPTPCQSIATIGVRIINSFNDKKNGLSLWWLYHVSKSHH